MSWCFGFNTFNPADQTGYLCKQCRYRWDGSWWAVSSGSTLFASLFLIFLLKPLFASVDVQRWKSPFQKLMGESVNVYQKKWELPYVVCKCFPVILFSENLRPNDNTIITRLYILAILFSVKHTHTCTLQSCKVFLNKTLVNCMF